MPQSLQGQHHPLALVAEQQAILRPGGRFRPFEEALRVWQLA